MVKMLPLSMHLFLVAVRRFSFTRLHLIEILAKASQGSRTDRTRQAAPTADHGRARKGHRVDLLSDGSGDRIDSIDKLDNIS